MRVNAPTVSAAALAFIALLPPPIASAEEIYRETRSVACPPSSVGCATFQGYIYVRRDGAAGPVHSRSAGSDEQLGERRLYLHLGAD